MVNAAAVISKCIKSKETGLDNEFYIGVKSLDGVDAFHSYLTSLGTKDLGPKEVSDLYNDAFWGTLPLGIGKVLNRKPGVWTTIMDIDKDSYYIARDAKGNIMRDKQGNPLYKYHETGELVEWDKIKNKKEKFWFFSRDAKRMIAAPSWWPGVKKSLQMYTAYLAENFPTYMTIAGRQRLNADINKFIEDIESGNGKQGWYNIIYNLYTTPRGNHWYLLSEILRGNTFDAMMSDKEVAKAMLNYDFSTVSFRDFSEAVAVYAGTARGGNVTVVDILGPKWADKIYGKEGIQLFDIDENGKVTPATERKTAHLGKSYFMKLNVKQQIAQIKQMLGKEAPSMEKFRDMVGIKIRWNKTCGWVLRGIGLIGQPWFYSALMTFGKGLAGFMPLLVLNSGMFVTDSLARGTRLKGDRSWFFKKWGLSDGLPEGVEGYSKTGVGETLADTMRRGGQFMQSALEQGLFNVGDMIMENSYKIRQYQRFFEVQFPGIKSVADINRELELMIDREVKGELPEGTVDQMLEAARGYSEYSVRLHTTNSPIISSLARVHPAKYATMQPGKDIVYTLWHFFAGWGYNKIRGAWQIVKTGLFDNIYHGKIGPQYLDELLSSNISHAEANARMTRAYLENEDLLYFMHKVYSAFFIAKYLDRFTESSTDKNEQNIFDDFGDMVKFLDVFSGEYAALGATPEGRLIKNFWDSFIGELENDAGLGTATQAGIAATVKEAFRSMFRKLYMPQIGVEAASLINKDWDLNEIDYIKIIGKSISDNVNGYLFYLKDKTENGDFSYYIPKGPNAYVNSILGISDRNIDFINRQKLLSKYANLFNTEQGIFELTEEQKNHGDMINDNHPFINWILYSFPFLKQWNISQLEEVEGFIDDLDSFRSTSAYQAMTNNKLPNDMRDSDWDYLYRLITGRLIQDKEKIDDDTLKGSYSFLNEYGEITYDKKKQAQEEFMHLLMTSGLTEGEAQKFSKMMDGKTDGYDEEAIRTLAYMEAKTPGSSLQALAYIMNREMLNYAFRSGIYYDKDDPESQKLKKDMMAKGSIEAAKKYAKYIPEIDRYRTWPQFILYYAKTHDTSLAKYIEGPGENNAEAMKLITPGSVKGPNDIVYQNKILTQNFQAQLMVDIEGASGNVDARKLMNGFALIFDTKKYENKDGTLNSKYAAYALNQLETIYNHINSLALDSNTTHMLKEGTLMFGDKLMPNIINDKELMQRNDVRQIVNDWAHYWYKEFQELDDIATEAAQDQLTNDAYKGKGSKKNYLKSGSLKKFPGYINWYNYMKNKYYDTYSKYRIFNWTPRQYDQNYLSEWEFAAAKRAQDQFSYHGENPNTSAKRTSGGKSDDDGIGVSSRRGKSIQNYKREDIDKPVEYKTPWRKRWVRRGSGTKPIATTTWKHLTPTPKR